MSEEKILPAPDSAGPSRQPLQVLQFRQRVDIDLELRQIRDAAPPAAGSESQFHWRVIESVSQRRAGFVGQLSQ